MTIMPWKMDRPLVWDACCVDTLAGAAEAGAANLKRRKYSNLLGSYVFEPSVVKTLGPWGPSATYNNIMRRLVDAAW